MNIEIDSKNFSKKLDSLYPKLMEKTEVTMKLICQKIRDDIITSMNNTPRDMKNTSFVNNRTKAHYASLPGNPPAPDTGRLKNSINYDVSVENDTIIGRVGSTLKDPPYGAYHEFGTSKNPNPRPWLFPAMDRNYEFARTTMTEVVKNIMGGK